MEILKINNLEVKVIRKKCSKRVVLRVDVKGEIKVTAPYGVTKKVISQFVVDNKEELIEKLAKIKMTEQHLVTGDVVVLFGKKYNLEVIVGNKNKLFLENNTLKMTVKKEKYANFQAKEKLLNDFYKKQLFLVLEKLIPTAERIVGKKAREYKIKNMKTKWGTCNITKERIWLNLALAKKPVCCLEAVLYHELIHFYETNHTPRFYNLLDQYYPQWREVDDILKSN